uniref:Eaf protein n=1 Tax=Globodera pallida TaxID=36090 RepID=A0A183CQI0_GLOPA
MNFAVEEMEREQNLKYKIDVLEAIKALRLSGKHTSPYVCDNIRRHANDFGGDLSDAAEDVCEDVARYIDRNFCIVGWLEDKYGRIYDQLDPEVDKARIDMIDALIERYKRELAC